MTEKSIILNAEINGLYNPDEAYVVTGPQQGELPSSFIVLHHKDIEPLLNGLKALGHETTEDFTATRINCAFKISHKNIVHDNELLKPIGSEFLTGLGPDFTGVAEGPQSLIAKTLMIDGHRIALSKSPHATPVTNPTVGEDGVESGDNKVLYPDGRIKETFTIGSTLFTHGNPTKAPIVPESAARVSDITFRGLKSIVDFSLVNDPDCPQIGDTVPVGVEVLLDNTPLSVTDVKTIINALTFLCLRRMRDSLDRCINNVTDVQSEDRCLIQTRACLKTFNEGGKDPVLDSPIFDGDLSDPTPPKRFTINGIEQSGVFTIATARALSLMLTEVGYPADDKVAGDNLLKKMMAEIDDMISDPVPNRTGMKLYGPNDKPLDLFASGVLPMFPDQPVTVIFRKEPVDPKTIATIVDALTVQINYLTTLVDENADYPLPYDKTQDALKHRDLHRTKACRLAFTEGRGDPILGEPDDSLYDGVLPPPKAYTINGFEQTPIFTIVVVMALSKKLKDTTDQATAMELLTLVRMHLPEPGDGTPTQVAALTRVLFPEFAKK